MVAAVGGAQRVDGLEASFLGRDRELRLVKEFFHASADCGAARLLAISGPAGMGKSRLAWEFEKYTAGLAATTLWHPWRALSYGEGVAFWALAAMVRTRCGIGEEEPPAAAASKLAVALERWIPDPTERNFLEPRVGALLGTADSRLPREELFAGWRTFFVRLAESSPVVLVIEDAEHADPGLLDFLEHLLDWAAHAPIFILTLARPELAERRVGWGANRRNASTLHLEPLSPPVMAALLDELVVGLPARVRDAIVARADGVPLYAMETIRSLIDREVIVSEGEVYRLVGEIGALTPPAGLAALVAARIDALPEGERILVRDLAVLGSTFPRPAVAAICPLPAAEVDALLAALVRKEVLSIRADPRSPERGQYAFTQGLLRTVAYDTLGRRDRKARHLAVAAHLRVTFPDDGEEIAEVIAAHYADAYAAAPSDPDAAGVRAEAVAAYRRAGDRALTVGAPETALGDYQSAAELATDEPARTELRGLAGRAAFQAGRNARAVELLEVAIAAHTAAGRTREAARLLGVAGGALGQLGRNHEVIGHMREAVAGLDSGVPDTDTADLAARLAEELVSVGHAAEAFAHLEIALTYAQALELPDVVSRALTARAIGLRSGGRHNEALISVEGAAEFADRHDLKREVAAAQFFAGDLRMTGDLPGAADRFESVLDFARWRGALFNEAATLQNLMLVHIFAGRWEEAGRLGADGLVDPDRPGAVHLHNRLALLCSLRGELASVAVHAQALDEWNDTDYVELRAMVQATRATIALANGDQTAALNFAWQAVTGGTGFAGLRTDAVRQAWPDGVEAALSLGRIDEVERLLLVVADRPRGHVPPYLRAQYARFRARLDAARGQHEVVENGFVTAETILAELGYPY
ncbi:MAG: ATP-binding protein [Mycobacteriales bacterium]